MQILVCGGAGYIGSHLVRQLIATGHSPVIFDNFSTGYRWAVENAFRGAPSGVELVQGDLLHKEDLAVVFSRYRFDAVMHFSALITVGESVLQPAKYYENNFVGTLNLLHAMQVAGVKNFVFSSSCAVHGIPEQMPIVETMPSHPINPYGQSKHMCECAMADFSKAYGLKTVSLRYFNAAGAHPDGDLGEAHHPETHLIPNAINAALGKAVALQIFGNDYPTQDGTCIRDYTHILDLADAHLLALDYLDIQPKSVFEPFNLGTGHGISVMEVIRSIEKIGGRKVPYRFSPRRPGDPPALYANADKAKKILGWRPKFNDIDAIIETAWKWHSSRD